MTKLEELNRKGFLAFIHEDKNGRALHILERNDVSGKDAAEWIAENTHHLINELSEGAKNKIFLKDGTQHVMV